MRKLDKFDEVHAHMDFLGMRINDILYAFMVLVLIYLINEEIINVGWWIITPIIICRPLWYVYLFFMGLMTMQDEDEEDDTDE